MKLLPLLGLLLLTSVTLRAEPVIEAFGELPADTRDQYGDTIGGIGSGLVYDAKEDVFLCIADRGPGDGTLPYRPRYVRLKIIRQGDKLDIRLLGSVLLRDENGHAMTGLIPDDPHAAIPRMKDGRTCLDPEAIALAPDGTLYITDEYGPYLYQFRRDGHFIRRITLPEMCSPRTADGKLDFTDKAQLVSGRNINQGPEGMTLLPDGKTVALAFQSGFIHAGGRGAPTTSLLLLDLKTGRPKALYAYPFAATVPVTGERLKAKKLSVNDLYALSDTRLLVLERDSFGRDGAAQPKPALYKAVWVADFTHATNQLTQPATTPVVPVAKQLLFNLPALVKAPSTLSAKWEGITVLPPHQGRQITLMMSADNDFLTPLIHHEGATYPFPRTQDSVPSQFFQIQAKLPRPVAEH